jgi:hypothetical protein
MRRMLIAGVAAVAVVSSALAGSAWAGSVTYTPQPGDGCGPLPSSSNTLADFIVLEDRLCGSYPWEAKRMLAGGVAGLHNKTRASHRLVAWKSSGSKEWNLNVVLRAGGTIEKRIPAPGRYYFRDPAHSRLERFTKRNGVTSTRCFGACGYLVVSH